MSDIKDLNDKYESLIAKTQKEIKIIKANVRKMNNTQSQLIERDSKLSKDWANEETRRGFASGKKAKIFKCDNIYTVLAPN